MKKREMNDGINPKKGNKKLENEKEKLFII